MIRNGGNPLHRRWLLISATSEQLPMLYQPFIRFLKNRKGHTLLKNTNKQPIPGFRLQTRRNQSHMSVLEEQTINTYTIGLNATTCTIVHRRVVVPNFFTVIHRQLLRMRLQLTRVHSQLCKFLLSVCRLPNQAVVSAGSCQTEPI